MASEITKIIFSPDKAKDYLLIIFFNKSWNGWGFFRNSFYFKVENKKYSS